MNASGGPMVQSGSSRRARAVVWFAGFVGLALLAVACSLPADSKPRAIDRSAVADLNPSTTVQPATTPPLGAPTIELYLFRDNSLTKIARRTNTGRDINSVLNQLLDGTTDEERADGYTTFIPPQTRLLRVQVSSNNTLVIDLSKEMDSVGGSTSKAAYAQLVFTATALPNVSQVQFRTEGNPVAVPTDNGNVPIADRTSYNMPYVVGGAATSPTIGATAAPPLPQLPSTVP